MLFFLAEILYRIVPVFYEEIEAALEQVYGADARERELPEILRFGSWVGGDMDGNPDVHAKTIRETLARQQQVIINRYFLECQGLAEKLSQSATRVGSRPSSKAHRAVHDAGAGRGDADARAHDRMPYRVFLGQIPERLRATYDARANHYDSAKEFVGRIVMIGAPIVGGAQPLRIWPRNTRYGMRSWRAGDSVAAPGSSVTYCSMRACSSGEIPTRVALCDSVSARPCTPGSRG